MSGRTLSTAFRGYLHARAPGDGALLLLRIAHADFATLRFAPEGEDVVSDGDTYEARAFRLALPMDEEGIQETGLELSIVSLDDDVVAAILAAEGDRPEVEVDVVLLSDPDTVETTFHFQMKSAAADASVLRATLLFEPVLVDPFPGPVFDSARFPDLYE